jgi:hypothetical protein
MPIRANSPFVTPRYAGSRGGTGAAARNDEASRSSGRSPAFRGGLAAGFSPPVQGSTMIWGPDEPIADRRKRRLPGQQ